jgi:hypothetical protein
MSRTLDIFPVIQSIKIDNDETLHILFYSARYFSFIYDKLIFGVNRIEWVAKLNKAIGYIEEHLRDELDYNEVCKICACSLPKFQQMFSITCGVPVRGILRCR